MNTRGVIVKETKVGDNDKIFTVFSEDLGKIQVSARGARRQGNRLAGVRLLCYASFTLFKNSKGYRLNEFELLNSFSAISRSIESLSLASYFSEIICIVSQERVADKRLLSLFLNALYITGKNEVPQSLIKAVFELKCACIIGYEPNLCGCMLCGGEGAAFSYRDGGCVCRNCRPGAKKIDSHVLTAMRYICSSPENRAFLFKASDVCLVGLSAICEEYLLKCVEITPNSLEMYKKLVTN